MTVRNSRAPDYASAFPFETIVGTAQRTGPYGHIRPQECCIFYVSPNAQLTVGNPQVFKTIQSAIIAACTYMDTNRCDAIVYLPPISFNEDFTIPAGVNSESRGVLGNNFLTIMSDAFMCNKDVTFGETTGCKITFEDAIVPNRHVEFKNISLYRSQAGESAITFPNNMAASTESIKLRIINSSVYSNYSTALTIVNNPGSSSIGGSLTILSCNQGTGHKVYMDNSVIRSNGSVENTSGGSPKVLAVQMGSDNGSFTAYNSIVDGLYIHSTGTTSLVECIVGGLLYGSQGGNASGFHGGVFSGNVKVDRCTIKNNGYIFSNPGNITNVVHFNNCSLVSGITLMDVLDSNTGHSIFVSNLTSLFSPSINTAPSGITYTNAGRIN